MSEHGAIGILLPDDGPDYKWYRLNELISGLPDISVGRIRSQGLHEAASLRALGQVERLMPQARALVRKGCGVLVWACTSASFIGGLEWVLEQSGPLTGQTGARQQYRIGVLRRAGSRRLARNRSAESLYRGR